MGRRLLKDPLRRERRISCSIVWQVLYLGLGCLRGVEMRRIYWDTLDLVPQAGICRLGGINMAVVLLVDRLEMEDINIVRIIMRAKHRLVVEDIDPHRRMRLLLVHHRLIQDIQVRLNLMLMEVHLNFNMKDTDLLTVTHRLRSRVPDKMMDSPSLQVGHLLSLVVMVEVVVVVDTVLLLDLLHTMMVMDSPSLQVEHLLSLVVTVEVVVDTVLLLGLLHTMMDMEDSLVVHLLARSGSLQLILILPEVRHRLNSLVVIILLRIHMVAEVDGE